jgi:hypothetical protein
MQSLAAMSGASAVRRLIREHVLSEPNSEKDSDQTGQFLIGMILFNGVRNEWRMLQNAVEYGLLDERKARTEAKACERRAREMFEKHLTPSWDFESKKRARPRRVQQP